MSFVFTRSQTVKYILLFSLSKVGFPINLSFGTPEIRSTLPRFSQGSSEANIFEIRFLSSFGSLNFILE